MQIQDSFSACGGGDGPWSYFFIMSEDTQWVGVFLPPLSSKGGHMVISSGLA